MPPNLHITIIFYLAAIFKIFSVSFAAPECGSDVTWTPYKDEKCFKLVNQLFTHDEARSVCAIEVGEDDTAPPSSKNPHQSSSLLTIGSAEEHKFVTKLIYRDLHVVHNVWLGARRRNGSNNDGIDFEWDDGARLRYTNWAEGSPSAEYLDKRCTQVTLRRSTYANDEALDGLWTDVSCDRRNLVMCQKSQAWTMIQVQHKFVQIEKELREKSDKLEQLQMTHEALMEKNYDLERMMQQQIDDLLLPKPRNCLEIQTWSMAMAMGIMPWNDTKQVIYPYGQWSGVAVEVQCDFATTGGGWTIIQRRKSGPMKEFFRDWLDYEEGFGSADENYWIGLRAIQALSLSSALELRVELEDWDGTKRHAHYSHFALSAPWDFYRLSVGGYSGDAGDSLSQHNGMRFSTKDKDNDENSSLNCAQLRHGAWWYRGCKFNSNLNGYYFNYADAVPYADGVHWMSWKGNSYSLRSVEMKIRDVSSYKVQK